MKSAAERAKELGLEVVWHAENFLFVDLDSAASRELFEVSVDKLMEAVPELVRGRYVSRSYSGNWHGYVYVSSEVTAWKSMVLIHLLLGSDPEHEKLALGRIKAMSGGAWDPPFVFFETAEEAARSRAWMTRTANEARAVDEAVVKAIVGEYRDVTTHVLRNGALRIAPSHCRCEHCVEALAGA